MGGIRVVTHSPPMEGVGLLGSLRCRVHDSGAALHSQSGSLTLTDCGSSSPVASLSLQLRVVFSHTLSPILPQAKACGDGMRCVRGLA